MTMVVVGGVALAAWFSAAMTPGRPPALVEQFVPAPIDATGAALVSEVARLRERLRPSPTPRELARNPFAFRSPAARPRMAAVSASPPPTKGALTVTSLRLTLAGIAEDSDAGGGGPVRTAIISGNGQVFLAKGGDIVVDQDVAYRVGDISSDSVELSDLRDGSTRRLRLK
jgi:hypothetical protein